METNINLTNDEVDIAINCMNKSIKCYQHAPLLNSEERNKHIKSCQEIVIKCYLDLLLNNNIK
jgi:hypothetical protein